MEVFIGTVQLFAFNYVPRGWLFCEGQLLPISTYQVLFALIGTNFGGDGVKTFALPDLRSAAPQGLRYAIAWDGLFPIRP